MKLISPAEVISCLNNPDVFDNYSVKQTALFYPRPMCCWTAEAHQTSHTTQLQNECQVLVSNEAIDNMQRVFIQR